MDAKSIIENLDEGLKNKLKACKSQEELDAVLKEYGGELSDDAVELAAGGKYDWDLDPACLRDRWKGGCLDLR